MAGSQQCTIPVQNFTVVQKNRLRGQNNHKIFNVSGKLPDVIFGLWKYKSLRIAQASICQQANLNIRIISLQNNYTAATVYWNCVIQISLCISHAYLVKQVKVKPVCFWITRNKDAYAPFFTNVSSVKNCEAYTNNNGWQIFLSTD